MDNTSKAILTTTESTPLDASPDFLHGYTNGVEETKKESYEGYLSSSIAVKWLGEQVAFRQAELARVEALIQENTAQYKQAEGQLYEHRLQANITTREKQWAEKDLAEADTVLQNLRQKLGQSTSKYSLMAGVLYLIAGFSFVFGDLIISHEIVAYSLNIRNNFEAWAFAVGLAMLSVLLKPAYERLIEVPYLDTKNTKAKTIYAWFKGSLVVFSVATLFILGYFRYEAYKTDKLKEGINKTIRALQLQQDDGVAPNDQTLLLMEAELRKIDALNQSMVSSWWALASFVLSGILFAIAGAVCLGIAFPILGCYWQRWVQISPALKKATEQRRIFQSQLKAIDERQLTHLVAQHKTEQVLANLTEMSELEEKRQEHFAVIEKLIEELKLHETDVRMFAFSNGYAKGETAREWMSPEEFEQYKSQLFSMNTMPKTVEKPIVLSKKSHHLRPYQAIRKLITEEFENGKSEE